MPITVALLVLTAAYWSFVVAFPAVAVAPPAWAGLFLTCVLGCVLALWPGRRTVSAAVWCYVASCAALLAGIFYGANIGLDALHGISRPKANVAASLGGLELWLVFLPGLTALALGCAAGSFVAQPSASTTDGGASANLVAGRPDHQFDQDGSEVDALVRQPIDESRRASGRVSPLLDSAHVCQLAQPVGQDVRRDALAPVIVAPCAAQSRLGDIARAARCTMVPTTADRSP